MKAEKLKETLTVEQIIFVMNHLGADYKKGSNDNEILFRTICHGGDSHKLYLYVDSKEFYCYSNCGHLDIINVVQQVMNINISQAIAFICNLVGIGDFNMNEGFYDEPVINRDLEIIESNKKIAQKVDMSRNFKVLDKKLLDRFYNMYHPAFLNDGIDVKTLHKFGIKYDILEQRIIIPHLDEKGRLIAIRCRNLNQDKIDEGKKYMPIILDGKLLSAKTSSYFYGMYYNQDNIRKAKKAILLESEKAIMQLDTLLEHNIGLALSSSSLSIIQVELLKELGVEEVIIGLDKEFKEYGDKDEKLYAMKIRKGIINKLLPFFNVSVMWDTTGLLDYKDSPTDKGKEVFVKLFNNRIQIER